MELENLYEIPEYDAILLERQLKVIEDSWCVAYDGKDCDEEKRKALVKEAQENLIDFLKKVHLYNEWNEFKIQKIGWPDFELFEVVNDQNDKVFLRLGPSVRKEDAEWSDIEFRIKYMRYSKHLEVLELKEKIRISKDYQRVYNEAMNKLTNRIWKDEDL